MARSSSTLSEVWARRICIGALMVLLAAVYEIHAQKQVSFCSLLDSANGGKTVTSTALMFYSTVGRVDGDDTFLYSPDCNGPDYFAIPKGNSKVWNKWNRFFRQLPLGKELILEIKFEGKSEIAAAYLFGSLDGWARAQIKLSKIISVKDVSETRLALAKWDTEKPEIERIERMRALLDTFLTSLYTPENTQRAVLDLMSDEFRFVDLGGRVFRKDQYPMLSAPWTKSTDGAKGSQWSYRSIGNSNDAFKWRARLEFAFDRAPSKTFYCDITLVRRADEWIIRDAKMLTKR